jgi:hypothetical protein
LKEGRIGLEIQGKKEDKKEEKVGGGKKEKERE